MARKYKLTKYGQEHKVGTLLEFDPADTEFHNKNVVVARVLYQSVPGGPFSPSPDFPPRNGKWQDVQDWLMFTPTVIGYYTLTVIGNVDGRPLSYRSDPVKVT